MVPAEENPLQLKEPRQVHKIGVFFNGMGFVKSFVKTLKAVFNVRLYSTICLQVDSVKYFKIIAF
jgi:hypothetical protein